ncbi:MAG: aminotransferase class V-fold PLP-dependent enzyme [Deltaproteobacteria bacterium]
MDINKIRDLFPALNQKVNGNDLIYFDNAASSLRPAPVINAIADYYSTISSNVHRSSHYLSSQSTHAYEVSREAVAEFINSNPGEIIFTGGTTDSLSFLASGLTKSVLESGDEIILTVAEHHSNIVPWVAHKNERNLHIKVVDVDENGDLWVDQYEELITEKTKVISLAHSSNVLGTINPVKEIIKIAKERNIITVIDGAQAVAHTRVDVNDIDCDFYCFSAHKMFGPMGIGILYGKSEKLSLLPPFRFGGGMIRNVNFDRVEFGCLPTLLEAGTPNVSGAVGLRAAIEFLKQYKIDDIITYEKKLTKYASERLIQIKGLSILGNSADKDPIIAFSVAGIHHSDLAMLLDNFGIAVRSGQHCTQPLMNRFGLKGTVRVSFSIYNTIEEIDYFIEKLKVSVSMLS